MSPTVLTLAAILVLGISLDSGFAIQITIDPDTFTTGESEDPKVACRLDEQEATAEEIEYMKISRKAGKALVALDEKNVVSYIAASEDEYKATGKVETGFALKNSYLDLVVVAPDTEDSGMYTCIVYFTDKHGEMIEKKASANLKVDDPGVKDLKGSIDNALDKLKKEENDMKEIEDKEKKNMEKVTEFEKQTEKQNQEMEDILNKESKLSAKATELEETITKKLKNLKEKSTKEEVDVESMKETIKTLVTRIKKEEEDISLIEENETEDKRKVKNLEEKTLQQGKLFKELDEKERKIAKEVSDILAKAKTQLEKVNILNKTGSAGNARVAVLTKKEAQHGKMINDLELKESNTRGKVNDLLQKVDDVLAKVRSLKPTVPPTTNTGIGTGLDNNIDGLDTPIYAFEATVEKESLELKVGSDIVLPDIIMLTGNTYNAKTGIFTAPVRGLYAFHLTLKLNCKKCYASIQVTANTKVLFRIRLGLQYDQDQGSASGVVKLEKGQTVKITTEEAENSPVLTVGRLSVFSGCLITGGLPNEL